MNKWLRTFLTLVALFLSPSLAIGQVNEVNLHAASDVLARELPIAIESREFSQLASYFAEDVELRSNIPAIEPIKGKKWVIIAIKGMRGFRSIVSSVVVSNNMVVVIQNIPTDPTVDRFEMAPVIDVFHLNSSGQIYLIERTIGDRVVHRSGRPNG